VHSGGGGGASSSSQWLLIGAIYLVTFYDRQVCYSERKYRKGLGIGRVRKGREWKDVKGQGRMGRERGTGKGGRARPGYLSRGSKFLVTPLH